MLHTRNTNETTDSSRRGSSGKEGHYRNPRYTPVEEAAIVQAPTVGPIPSQCVAYGYLRVSHKSQLEGDGFARQEAAIRKYVAENGIELAGVFRERGVSGTTDGDERQAWVDLMALLMKSPGGADTIIIEGMDRLARELMVQEYIIKDLKRRGIKLRSIAEPDLCSSDPTRVLVRQILGAVAQYERQMIVLKLRGARTRKKAAEGRCEGAKPYGHYPGEHDVLARMVNLRGQGLSVHAVAETLNGLSIKPRRGAKWHENAIARILRKNLVAA